MQAWIACKKRVYDPTAYKICLLYNHSIDNCRHNLRNQRVVAINQNKNHEEHLATLRGRERPYHRGWGKDHGGPQSQKVITCYYFQPPRQMMRECLLRLRHQAKKQVELEKLKKPIVDVQMMQPKPRNIKVWVTKRLGKFLEHEVQQFENMGDK